jgi:molybdenum cofactor cytidylyltransferase
MKFGPFPVAHAAGKILGHNIYTSEGWRAFKKGAILKAEDIVRLENLGRDTVYAAEIEPGDILEDEAALQVARAVQGRGVRLSRPAAGRVNLFSQIRGVVRIDSVRLSRLNTFEGLTLATLQGNLVVSQDQMVGTVKIIPYAVPAEVVARAIGGIAAVEPLIRIDPLLPRRIGLILTGAASATERLRQSYETPLRQRAAALGSELSVIDLLTLDQESDEIVLASLIQRTVSAGFELLILAGDTAIMDRADIAPRAVERAGGEIECVGVPIDPGNMLMLGYVGEVPVLGVPGCARSLKTNAIDWVLPRLLANERLRRSDITQLALGGLLEDTSKRPMPRSRQK